MQDMIDLLGSLREQDTTQPTSPHTVAQDMARAHRAQARRRLRRTTGTGAVAAVVAVAVGVVAAPGSAHPAAVASAPSATRQQIPSVRLDAYTGVQPAGFTVATVPSGWTVRASNDYAFVVIPPDAVPVKKRRGVVNFQDAVTVMLQSASTPGPGFTAVTVDGHPGELGLTSGKGATWLIYSDGAGHKVLVQVPVMFQLTNGRTVRLTDAQILQFASGITVTGAAKAASG